MIQLGNSLATNEIWLKWAKNRFDQIQPSFLAKQQNQNRLFLQHNEGSIISNQKQYSWLMLKYSTDICISVKKNQEQDFGCSFLP